MPSIKDNLQAARQAADSAANAAGRDPAEIALVAVCKTFPPERIAEAIAAGQRDFGENYLREAKPKIRAAAELTKDFPPPTWHFIGAIQNNKAAAIAQIFDWAHGVARLSSAKRLSDARKDSPSPLQICLQVNTSGESAKSGIAPDETIALARQAAILPGISLRGLMTITAADADANSRRAEFRLLREIKDEIVRNGIGMDSLSMGMSADFADAIAEGATLIRLGTAIFGARERKK